MGDDTRVLQGRRIDMTGITEWTNWAVDLIEVVKTYPRGVQALRGVNIQVGRGEVFGLLGPNGAGKTTLVKIMTAAVRPTSAAGTVLGRRLGHRGKLAKMGYLSESPRFPRYLTGRKVLDYYGALARVPRKQRVAKTEEWLSRLYLERWGDIRVDRYSKGMLQRLGLAQALMNDPELVVLDEPTDGLDPVGRRDVRELLLSLRGAGTTVFLNSHLLSELEMVCDRVAILVDGLVARQGTLRELTEQTVEYQIKVQGDVRSADEDLGGLGAKRDGSIVIVAGSDLERVNSIIDYLRKQNLQIESVVPHRFSLEDILVQTLGTRGDVGSAVAGPEGGTTPSETRSRA